jgi:hypothetical protein
MTSQYFNDTDKFDRLTSPSDKLHQQFILSPIYVATHLEKYYILHWTGEHLSNVMMESTVGSYLIHHQGVEYKLETLNFKLTDLVPTNQYKISFRKPKLAPTGVALIKKVTGDSNVPE